VLRARPELERFVTVRVRSDLIVGCGHRFGGAAGQHDSEGGKRCGARAELLLTARLNAGEILARHLD
jgi:hypothetical protein